MNDTTQIIGYRVKSGEQFVRGIGGISYEETKPISLPDAYRRLANFLEEFPEDVERFGVPEIIPVHRKLTPLECTARELGALLTSLTSRHNLNLGLSQDQIEKKIIKELAELGASPVKSFGT